MITNNFLLYKYQYISKQRDNENKRNPQLEDIGV